MVLEKTKIKFHQCISLFRNHLPYEKGEAFIWTNLNPLHKRMLCLVWLKLVQWYWRRRWKCEKFTTTTTTTTTNNGQILIRKVHFSLRLRWAKNGKYRVDKRINLLLHITVKRTEKKNINKQAVFYHRYIWVQFFRVGR